MMGLATFACGESSNQNSEGVDLNNSRDNVEDFSGENITPQVDLDSGSNQRLEVDTISSAEGAEREKGAESTGQ